MKLSKYNYTLYDEEWGYWCNVLTLSYFRLNSSLSRKLEDALEDIENIDYLPKTIYDKLVEGGFVIEDNSDELEKVREYNQRAVEDKNYMMIVLPTLNCNYKCWYCIQDHVPSLMSESTMDKLKRHIDRMVDVEKIESLRIDWFGGEPLMYFDKVVVPISEYAIAKCEEAGIPFMNSATTNGYFLNDKVIKELKHLKFTGFQITLDGERESHNKVKFIKGCDSTFDHVLHNIDAALSHCPELSMNLRINYTHSNLTPEIIEEVNTHISEANRKRVTVAPHKVWQEDVDKEFDINPYMDGFAKSGYNVSRWNPVSNFIPCYVSKKFYNAINPDGKIVKCTACDDIYGENAYGTLKEDGTIEVTTDKNYQARSFENERCLACKQLPLCMGLCPRDHLNGCTHCKEEVVDSTFEQRLLNFLKSNY